MKVLSKSPFTPNNNQMLDRSIPISQAAWEYLDEAIKRSAKHYNVKYVEKGNSIPNPKVLTGKEARRERRKKGKSLKPLTTEQFKDFWLKHDNK